MTTRKLDIISSSPENGEFVPHEDFCYSSAVSFFEEEVEGVSTKETDAKMVKFFSDWLLKASEFESADELFHAMSPADTQREDLETPDAENAIRYVQYLYDMSHRLRTPLATLGAVVEPFMRHYHYSKAPYNRATDAIYSRTYEEVSSELIGRGFTADSRVEMIAKIKMLFGFKIPSALLPKQSDMQEIFFTAIALHSIKSPDLDINTASLDLLYPNMLDVRYQDFPDYIRQLELR